MTQELLKQAELFDSPLTGAVKSDTNLMEFPFFDLSKNGRSRGIFYDDGKVSIQIKAAGAIATIYDKDILIYIASLMVERMNRGETPSQTLTFTAHDYMRVTSKNRSARTYERIASALKRLQGTQITTNIETGGEGVTDFFSWIQEARINYIVDKNQKKIMSSITVRVCDFIYRAILKDKSFLTYHIGYFDLSPLERRVYELARKHCGKQDFFKISLERFHEKIGTENHLRGFKHSLQDIIERDVTPEYHIAMMDDGRSEMTKRHQENGLVPLNKSKSLKDILVCISPRQVEHIK